MCGPGVEMIDMMMEDDLTKEHCSLNIINYIYFITIN